MTQISLNEHAWSCTFAFVAFDQYQYYPERQHELIQWFLHFVAFSLPISNVLYMIYNHVHVNVLDLQPAINTWWMDGWMEGLYVL